MYIWAQIPEPYAAMGSIEFAKRLLAEAQDRGVARHRLRRLRRRPRALRADRERAPHAPGGARHQGHVPQGRPDAGDARCCLRRRSKPPADAAGAHRADHMKPIKVGLLGIGTVGSGTFEVLQRNQEEIKRRAGRGIEITVVADARRRARARASSATRLQVVDRRARGRSRNPDIDIVVELIGGYGIARDAGARGDRRAASTWSPPTRRCSPCTATRSSPRRTRKGVMVAFEAAVAGGIPIIKALREGLTANRIEWIAGIINGTTNFILSEMRAKGLRLRRGAEGGAAPGLRRGRPDLRHRRHRRRAQARPS